MMNNKGFTVVELLTSFTLTMIIMVFLFEIVLQVKDVYVDNALRAKTYDKNAIVAVNLNNKLSVLDKNADAFSDGDIIYIECADNSCDAVRKNGTVYKVVKNYICIGKINGNDCEYESSDESTKKSIIIDGQTIGVPNDTEIKSYEIKRPVVFGRYNVNDTNGAVTFSSLNKDKNSDNNYVKVSYTVTGDDLTNDITFDYIYSYRYNYYCTSEDRNTAYCEKVEYN